MSFHSFDFLVFFLAFLSIYWQLPHRAQNVALALGSYFFYGYGEPYFVLLLLLSTAVDYRLALAIAAEPSSKRKLWLWASIALNLGLLAVFKYGNFAIENATALLQWIGHPVSPTTLQIALPAGISFYTFQSLSYIVDVYRGRTAPCRSLRDYAVFVSFFPQLVAGPIERSEQLLPQIDRPRALTASQVTEGAFLIAWGLFQKLVLADNVAMVANQIFSIHAIDFWTLWTGVFAFGIQIYADFSGYSDVARGAAKLLGIELTRNFRHPYFSESPAEFWRRWHITLGQWFKDYVYRPLLRENASRSRRAWAYVVVFLASGLWHGASWNFVLWGAFHAVVMLVCLLVAPIAPRWFVAAERAKPLRIFSTFVVVNVGWLFFREHDVSQILRYLSLSPLAPRWAPLPALGYFWLVIVASSLPLAAAALWESRSAKPVPRHPAWPLAYTIVFVVLLWLFAAADPSNFIYFQF